MLLAALTVACGTSPAATPVPTFEASSSTTDDAAGGRGDGLPTDCEDVLTVGDLGAILGLPLESVAVRSTIGVPAPSVGRTARLACHYTGTANAGGARGRTLLDINSSRYVDEASATDHWRINAAAEDGERRELSIGAASAVLIERPRESVLMVTHAANAITLVLPDLPLPGNRSRADALIDLALRVLPGVAGPSSTPTSSIMPTVLGPAVASGQVVEVP